ncbi:MAG: ABC transporter ATP-binding protein [Candidatus Nanopelagicales bacterium]|nr:ABC transporter ATP-binding protein [Candidatus Nanopelagicales bacterium]
MVIELTGVRKTYSGVRSGRTVAVDGLSLTVPRGGVHGFLGPNGSGKTTTIRILLGLVAADAGEVRVLGARVPHELARVTGSVGALVESPQLFPSFSGRRNLQILATLADLPATRVDELLEFVGLADRADDRVKGYSLGMRQRLAIAAAMLKSPALLILDEPTNGLDPAGMVEVRELIRALGSDGRTTVFLSSHLLAEVAAVCDAVTILRRGQLVASGDVAEVLAMAGGGGQLRIALRDADEAGRAAAVLGEHGISAAPAPPAGLLVASDDGAGVNAALGAAGIWARELAPVRPDLERAFLDLTADGEAVL